MQVFLKLLVVAVFALLALAAPSAYSRAMHYYPTLTPVLLLVIAVAIIGLVVTRK